MIFAGVSVIFKHLAEQHKDVYRGAMNAWAKSTSGLSERQEISQWLFANKEAAKAWLLEQPDVMQQAQVTEKMWSSLSGYLMLGSACGLSAVIIFWLVRGVMRERAEARDADVELAATADKVVNLVIAASCTPNDLPAVRMGAQIAAGLTGGVTLLICEEAGTCEASISAGRQVLEQNGITPQLVFAAGKPYQEILDHSASASLLVIGSRPLSTMDPRYHLGDNATRIVRNMTTSTLVVRGRDRIARILLCIDVPQSQSTVRMARDIAMATQASVEILYVASLPMLHSVETPSGWDDSIAEDLLPEFYAQELTVLNRVKFEFLDAGVGQVTVKLREGFVEEEIIRESVEGDFDLIIMKEGYFRTPFGLLLGRLSTNVATHSPQASVLIVKR
jgi:nucleotide-binding universal stress UspA family protein